MLPAGPNTTQSVKVASYSISRSETELRVSSPTRVMLAIATRLYREGLEIALESSGQVTVVGRARRASEIAAITKQVAAQVMLLDIDMPGSFDAIEVEQHHLSGDLLRLGNNCD